MTDIAVVVVPVASPTAGRMIETYPYGRHTSTMFQEDGGCFAPDREIYAAYMREKSTDVLRQIQDQLQRKANSARVSA